MRIHRFPSSSPPHIAYIKDRPRNSGLTSLRFIGGNRFVCCDFNEKRIYLAEFSGSQMKILASAPTVIEDGTPVETDLLDVNDEGLFVVSNFYQGSQSFFELRDDRLVFVEELKLTNFIRCHGVRFVPGYSDLLWVSYCDNGNRCLVMIDYRKKRVLYRMPMPEQMQDTAFLGEYALSPARTDHIRVKTPYEGRMYATVYLFRLPQDLRREPPQVIDVWHGDGHLDAMKEFDGQAYSANQYTDAVDVFRISAAERVEQRPSIEGFAMPHGLDVRSDGLLGVTNYTDNSVRFVDLAPALVRSAAEVQVG